MARPMAECGDSSHEEVRKISVEQKCLASFAETAEKKGNDKNLLLEVDKTRELDDCDWLRSKIEEGESEEGSVEPELRISTQRTVKLRVGMKVCVK